MYDYTEQAEEFLKKNNVKIDMTLKDKAINRIWNDNVLRNRYTVKIITELGTYKFNFWDSQYNTMNNIKPSVYIILADLQKYDPEDFETFCMNCGFEVYDDNYDGYNHRAMKMYNAACEQYENLMRIFTDEQMEELQENLLKNI